MAELTFTAVVDDSHILHLELPPEIRGEVEIVVRERFPERAPVGSGAAILEALRSAPPAGDPAFWERAREELYRSRDEWDKE